MLHIDKHSGSPPGWLGKKISLINVNNDFSLFIDNVSIYLTRFHSIIFAYILYIESRKYDRYQNNYESR